MRKRDIIRKAINMSLVEDKRHESLRFWYHYKEHIYLYEMDISKHREVVISDRKSI